MYRRVRGGVGCKVGWEEERKMMEENSDDALCI